MTIPTLTRVQRLDSIPIDQTYFTEEGYLIDHPIVTSTGIFEYKNPDGSTRRELRLPEDVFADKSLKSYKGKPVIITHDAGYINKDNVEQENIGTILSDGYQDGDDVRVEIVIHDTDAMRRCGLLQSGSGFQGGKERIVEFFNKGVPLPEFADFLKKEYGIGGRTFSFNNGEEGMIDYDSKGIREKRWGDDKSVKLHPWKQVAQRISELILAGKYQAI